LNAWLEPIARALDGRAAPLTIFFRDDDAGWGDEALFALLAVFDRYDAPVDLAVIPNAIAPEVAARLARHAQVSRRLGLHQHGFAHVNHEPSGRPCEFGPSRSPDEQRRDIEEGRRRLLSLFGSGLDSIFTPPWNRCTAATAECLRDAGITVLSRDASAAALDAAGLVECPITSDWLWKRQGARVPRGEWAGTFADAIGTADLPIGVMLHHAVMDDEERQGVGALLGLFRNQPNVRLVSMSEAARCRLAIDPPKN
jgi:hypothetical protein